ncbi:diadenylate cyclase CdaA [Capnocytophaga canimorsus]|uniref:Diadenylate cyclase n=1 Tax=Capnocytophaga canimorsus (strain 5) TaxID=860228 RepID=F9YRY2_CAPCC|nr:diadenylate cyclase CdaA [Capnocytophaga canimorsus]AEK23783.1 Uncharacterized protein ybbP [Capnocytophaga canimorsus Cc5]VEJ18852.1 DNA integrity scanning protein DisA [Capnocytophaga canimorsus]
MELIEILNFTLADFIDILLVALLLYYVYKLSRGTVAINIFWGIVIIYLIWKITEALEMELLSNILGQFIGVGVFALIVVFQEEIRRFLLTIGSHRFSKSLYFMNLNKKNNNLRVEVLVSACQKLAATHTGALIVLERNISLDFVRTTGDKMDIDVNEPILESIFYKNSPLHDGAIVIKQNRIVATRVVLPVVSQNAIPKKYGLRHRAATSITEKTDATALVVSEETGKISYFKNGGFVHYKNDNGLIELIVKDLA